ncbi:MAG: sugar phosphate isomerase/epimerase family protein [Eubacteriales bacterium]
MKLSISNIAWDWADDAEILAHIVASGFSGIEVAPTRVISENPYDHLDKANDFYNKITALGLSIPSMQSIWFGRTERVFFGDAERASLLDYSKKAIDFAEVLHCENLVFGSPKNRVLADKKERAAGLDMIAKIGEYAAKKDTVFAIEANPAIYNTNFINRTDEAFALVREIGQKGLGVNVDMGTVIENGEDIGLLEENMDLINHVHISEPYLAVPKKRELHRELAQLLRANGYHRFVSIEMKNCGDIETVKQTMSYVSEVFK